MEAARRELPAFQPPEAPIQRAISAAQRAAGIQPPQQAISTATPPPRIPLFLQSDAAAGCIRLSLDGNHELDLCGECVTHLQRDTVPPHSLARVDNGVRPPNLAQLNMLEERLLAVNRAVRSIVVCRPASAKITPEEGHLMLRSHVIGFRGPGPNAIASVFPPSPSQIPDLISVILIGAAQTYDDVVALARKCPALTVRGKVVAMWSRHLAVVYSRLGLCEIDHDAIRQWEDIGTGVPDALVKTAVYTRDLEEANAFLDLLRSDQEHYSRARYGTEEEAAVAEHPAQSQPPGPAPTPTNNDEDMADQSQPPQVPLLACPFCSFTVYVRRIHLR